MGRQHFYINFRTTLQPIISLKSQVVTSVRKMKFSALVGTAIKKH